MENKKATMARRAASLFLLVALAFGSLIVLIPNKPAQATSPTGIAPGSGASPSDYTFQLTDTNTYVNFGTNFYADQINIYDSYVYFTNIALGSASNPPRTFGIGTTSGGNATITTINTNDVITSMQCTVSTYCYDFYYYDLGLPLSQIIVTQGSSTTTIPSSSFTTDPAAFSVMAAPAVYWNSASRYYEVKVFFSGSASVNFEQNTGTSGITPVSSSSVGTAYSVASDPDFQRVYEDPSTTNAIMLDAEPTNGTYYESSYNTATGITTNTSTGIANGGNTVNSASYFSPVEINNYVWAVGRDSTTGKNVYALRTTNALSAVNATSQTSTYVPRDIAQSTTKIYSPLYDNTTNGTIYLGQQTRAYGTYTEPSLYAGTGGTPAHGMVMDTSGAASSLYVNLYAGNVAYAAEKVTSTSVLVGKSIDRLTVYLSKTGSPTGTYQVGVWDINGNLKTSFGTGDAPSLAGIKTAYTFQGNSYLIKSGDYIGIKYTGGSAGNSVDTYKSNSDVFDSTNSIISDSLTPPTWTDSSGNDLIDIAFSSNMKTFVVDGSPDKVYTVFESGTSSLKVAKYAGAASLLSGTITHTAGTPFSVIQLTDKVLIQTDNALYVLNYSTDAIASLYSNTFNTRYAQTYLLSPTGRTYNTNAVFIANSTFAINYTPNLGTGVQTGVIVSSVNDATGALNVYAPAKYYYLTLKNLTVESSTATGTTWTISQLGSMVQLSPTAWSEHLGIALQGNSTLFGQDVFRLVCGTASYHYILQKYAISDDSGCTGWRILATSADTVGREIFQPYSRNADLVHTSPQTAYTFTVSTTDPTIYTLKSIYNNKIVDVSIFDASGNAQQHYLFGQCYSIQVINNNDGTTINPGQVCANNAFTKNLNLQTINVPQNWTDAGWHYNVTRTFGTGNVTTSNIQFTVKYNPTPYTARVLTTDSYLTNYQTFHTWYNFTNVNATSTVAITKPNNSTIYFIVYDNHDVPRLTVASHGKAVNLSALTNAFAPIGNLFGIPLTAFFVILGAAIFVKSNSPFGVIVVAALAGFMFATGLIPISAAAWGGIMVVAALGAIYAIKRF